VPGTSRYLILERERASKARGSPFSLHLSLSPRLPDFRPLPRMPFHLDELPFLLVVHFANSSSLFSLRLYIRPRVVPARIPRTREEGDASPGTLARLYAVVVSAEGIGTRGLMFRN